VRVDSRPSKAGFGSGRLPADRSSVDERDLDPGLFRVVLDLLERVVLEERLVELLLADVEPAEALADERASRVLRKDLLIELDRLRIVLAKLVERGEIHQDQLGLGIPRQRLPKIMLGAVECPADVCTRPR
jgi:hypothetical protein